jgi:hypothetical protein
MGVPLKTENEEPPATPMASAKNVQFQKAKVFQKTFVCDLGAFGVKGFLFVAAQRFQTHFHGLVNGCSHKEQDSGKGQSNQDPLPYGHSIRSEVSHD